MLYLYHIIRKEVETMKLLTKEIEKRFEKYPLYSQDGKGLDAEVVVKFFNPCGVGTWLITEGQKNEKGKWEMFGMAELGGEWEWGYINFEELENFKGRWGLGIERDMYSTYTTVGKMQR